MKRKKGKKFNKVIVGLWVLAAVLIIFLAAIVFLAFFQKSEPSIYVYPENPKQGDTVFVRVKSNASQITGNLGQERLVFYKKLNSNVWISFLGIDADQNPGNYTVSADTSSAEHLKKDIKISPASFSSAPTVKAPPPAQTGITAAKAVNNIRTNDNPAINKILSNFTQAPYFTSPFSFPLNKIKISGFSFGKFIGFAKDKLQHFGVDLQAPEKTNIYAVNDGKVMATLDLSNYGKTIIIDHGLDIFSLYLHLDNFKVAQGDMVKRGQLIGLSGETGYATAPHLHFSMRVGDSRVDPLLFIDATQKMNDNLFLADLSSGFMNLIDLIKK
jgi:murein DD-endopeptidase MepM/ murein hydrolase activator NlpD